MPAVAGQVKNYYHEQNCFYDHCLCGTGIRTRQGTDIRIVVEPGEGGWKKRPAQDTDRGVEENTGQGRGRERLRAVAQGRDEIGVTVVRPVGRLVGPGDRPVEGQREKHVRCRAACRLQCDTV